MAIEITKTMKRATLSFSALAAIALVAFPVMGAAAGTAERSKVPKVTVADDYFAPTSKTLHVGQHGSKKVKFKWAANVSDSHNVRLKSGPASLSKKEKKKFKSATGTSGKFVPTFKKKGTYNFTCSIHPTSMKVKVKVKR